MKTIQYTLRNVPPDIDTYLRREAKRLGRSLNKVAVDYLTLSANEHVEMGKLVEAFNKPTSGHWIDEFAMRGTVDDSTKKILKEQEKLDKQRMKREF